MYVYVPLWWTVPIYYRHIFKKGWRIPVGCRLFFVRIPNICFDFFQPNNWSFLSFHIRFLPSVLNSLALWYKSKPDTLWCGCTVESSTSSAAVCVSVGSSLVVELRSGLKYYFSWWKHPDRRLGRSPLTSHILQSGPLPTTTLKAIRRCPWALFLC